MQGEGLQLFEGFFWAKTQPLKTPLFSCSRCRGLKRNHHAVESPLPHHGGNQEVYLVLILSLLGDKERAKYKDATPGITGCLSQRVTAIFAVLMHPIIRQ